MKCDELKVYVPQDGPYGLEPEEGGKLEEEETCYLKSDVDAAIAELKAENERLKKCEIWMKQHFYCEEVIACESAKNRRLKRALWLARAERALTEAERYRTLEVGWKMFRGDYETAKEYSNLATKCDNVEQLCKSKAEEYR